MKTIWKFPLSLRGQTTLRLSVDADILGVQNQREAPVLYVLQTPDGMQRSRTFESFFTGDSLPVYVASSRFIGTVMLAATTLVCHVFEVTDA